VKLTEVKEALGALQVSIGLALKVNGRLMTDLAAY